ncbi:hypothetical protein JQ596_18200 [Bradyrhizobium manausense]|uniref:hypothetical protein n=1 Tax=Bradyrhizobium manausense TaxID=989370 RepID=UPI001BAB6595|nr:hypothetical protein [Bradyrhizobium manausense]MBR0827461.1 hypothetical protein [Bradyrhizobium manausense]
MQQDLQTAPRAQPAPKTPGMWQRIQSWDSRLSVTKGLTIVTLLTGFFGGYFQYLNSYEEKVGEQAKADMATATKTFIEISNAFAEVQMQQEIMLGDFAGALNDRLDAGIRKMDTKAANDLFPNYIKARTALRQNSAVFAREAEIYVDWPSDLTRDPAAPRALNQDPLTEALLDAYEFDCDAKANLPSFEGTFFDGQKHGPANEPLCTPAPGEKKTYVDLCARTGGNGAIDPGKDVININWWSAKHHVLTLHYCFETMHAKLRTARIWASQNEVSEEARQDFLRQKDHLRRSLEHQGDRLNAFMTLTMSQLERIRVRYRPSGFFCHVPLVRDAIGVFSNQCLPIRTAVNERG